MPVQDDERERELVRVCNLQWDPAHQRAGVDAVLDFSADGRDMKLQVEVKSTTGKTVSTARDVGMEHIGKWRRRLFVIGFYTREARRPELQRVLCLTPLDMEPWIASVEAKMLIDFRIAQRASRKLELDDLFDVCGRQSTYSLEDAKRLHKQQWTAEQYAAAFDAAENAERRYSPQRMLDILRLRSQYIAERGATLNNPHITKAHLEGFYGSERDVAATNWASAVRSIAAAFAREHPHHPALMPSSVARPGPR